MKKIISLLLGISLLLTSCTLFEKESNTVIDNNTAENLENQTNTGTTQNTSWDNLDTKQQNTTMRKLQNGDVVAIMTTNKGKIEIFLDTENAPITTANFIGLAKKDYYNGIIFHRVIKGFMIQSGDPTATGMWGESIYGEKFLDEFSPELQNEKFTIAMANSGPDTNGSQFFINVVDNHGLDNKHSVFGEVVSGQDNVLKISKVKTDAADKPENEIKIISLEIKQYENGKYKEFEFDEQEAKKEYEDYLENIDTIREEAKKKEIEAKKDMKIKLGSIVTFDFTLKNEDGKEITSSQAQAQIIEDPELLSGFNDALKGMKIGESKTLTLTPDIGYGEYREDLKKEVPLSDLDQIKSYGIEIKEGVETPVGKILEIKEDTVILDTNNPFAGKTMILDFTVTDIN